MTPSNPFIGLILLYGSILIFNILFSSILWSKTQAKHYKYQALACLLLLTTGIGQCLLIQTSYIVQVLVSSTVFFGFIMFTRILCLVIGLEYRLKHYSQIYILGIALSLLAYFLGIHPSYMAIPALIGTVYPLFSTAFIAVFFKRNLTFVTKCFAWTGLLTSLHNIDYAFAYTHVEWMTLGFTIALVGIFALTTFSTATVLETLASENTQIRMEVEYGAMLANSARLASLGQMAGGVAHEINNPLAIIQMHAHQLKRVLQTVPIDQTTALRGVVVIEDTVFRINKIIAGLQSFGRDAGSDPFETVALKDIVESTLQFSLEKFKSLGIEIKKENFTDVKVKCRPVQISQVIFSLINNSSDALSERDQDKWIKLEMVEEEKFIKLLVTDNGSGIPVEIREKIFHPFFTTKEVGVGAGLGLSSSLGIIESNQGALYLDNKAPHTTFVVSLPRA